MESNKEEAFRCLKIAENCWKSGDKDKAERFAVKAMKLYPSNEAKGLSTCLMGSGLLILTPPYEIFQELAFALAQGSGEKYRFVISKAKV